jgi:hypothetical protein
MPYSALHVASGPGFEPLLGPRHFLLSLNPHRYDPCFEPVLQCLENIFEDSRNIHVTMRQKMGHRSSDHCCIGLFRCMRANSWYSCDFHEQWLNTTPVGDHHFEDMYGVGTNTPSSYKLLMCIVQTRIYISRVQTSSLVLSLVAPYVPSKENPISKPPYLGALTKARLPRLPVLRCQIGRPSRSTVSYVHACSTSRRLLMGYLSSTTSSLSLGDSEFPQPLTPAPDA